MKKAILINDTSFEGHHGCSFVVEAIIINMKNRGFEIVYSVPVGINWEDDLEALRILPTLDLIIVNGEGTLHHSQQRALEMVRITAFAKKHAIICVLINSSYEKNNDVIANYVKDFDFIYVRDQESLRELKENNIDSEVIPDLSFYTFKRKTILKNSKLLGYTDSVFPNITAKLFEQSRRNRAEFCPILRSDSTIIEPQYIPYAINSAEEYYKKISSYSSLITGRYHAVCLALQARVPFYALPSNSNKIEALLKDIGLNLDRIKLIENGFDLEIPFAFSNLELEKISAYIHKARKKIENMFDTISNITKQSALDMSILSRYVKPNDRVLDYYCGIGKRTRAIYKFYPVSSVFGFDTNQLELEYAKSMTNEHCIAYGYTHNIAELCNKDNSYDLIIFPLSKLEVSKLGDLSCELYRILAPGGRLIFFGNQSEYLFKKIDNLAIFDHLFIHESFSVFDSYALKVFMKSPLDAQNVPYQERVFSNLAKSNPPSLNYRTSYYNPWLQHAMVTYGLRLNNKKELVKLCETVLVDSKYSILEQSAAITVKAYQILEDDNVTQDAIELILQKIGYAINLLNNDEPETIRWFVSLSFVKAKLWHKIGNFKEAIVSFEACSSKNIFLFGVHLATKVTEALFHAGELSYILGYIDNTMYYWKRCVEFGSQLQTSSIDDILINSEFPNLFDHGDGVREYILAWDWIARSANGLHLIKRDGCLKDGSYEDLQKSFLYQYQQVTQDMFNLSSEVVQLREELQKRTKRLEVAGRDLVDRTQRLVDTENELVDRTQRLECTIDELSQMKMDLEERTKRLEVAERDLIDRTHRLERSLLKLKKYQNAKIIINGKIIL